MVLVTPWASITTNGHFAPNIFDKNGDSGDGNDQNDHNYDHEHDDDNDDDDDHYLQQ